MRISFDKKIWGAAALCACLIASCAKESDVSYTQIEQRSLDAWMKLHKPKQIRAGLNIIPGF